MGAQLDIMGNLTIVNFFLKDALLQLIGFNHSKFVNLIVELVLKALIYLDQLANLMFLVKMDKIGILHDFYVYALIKLSGMGIDVFHVQVVKFGKSEKVANALLEHFSQDQDAMQLIQLVAKIFLMLFGIMVYVNARMDLISKECNVFVRELLFQEVVIAVLTFLILNGILESVFVLKVTQ